MSSNRPEVDPEGGYPPPSRGEEAKEVLELRSLDDRRSYQTPGLMSAEEMYFSSTAKRRGKFSKERLDLGMSSPNFCKRSVFTRLGKHPYNK